MFLHRKEILTYFLIVTNLFPILSSPQFNVTGMTAIYKVSSLKTINNSARS